jgi:hypothetical protein
LVDDSSLIAGCSATVDGTGASANNGTVTAKYSNGTGKLSTSGVGNLHIYNVHGCAGLVNTATRPRSSAPMPSAPSRRSRARDTRSIGKNRWAAWTRAASVQPVPQGAVTWP